MDSDYISAEPGRVYAVSVTTTAGEIVTESEPMLVKGGQRVEARVYADSTTGRVDRAEVVVFDGER